MAISLYYGDDLFHLQAAIKTITDEAVHPRWVAFNYSVLDASNTDDMYDAFAMVRTSVCGEGQRLTIIKDFPFFTAGKIGKLKSVFEQLLENLSPKSHIIFVNKKINKSLTACKLVKKYGKIVEFSKIPIWKDAELLSNVITIAESINLEMSVACYSRVADHLVNDSVAIYNELIKLKTLDEVTVKIIDELIVTSQTQVFELASYLKDKELAKSLSIVHKLSLTNEPPLKLVGLLMSKLKQWLLYLQAKEQGITDRNTLAQLSGVGNPNRLYFMDKRLKNVDINHLRKMLRLLVDFECKTKEGYRGVGLLHVLVAEICI